MVSVKVRDGESIEDAIRRFKRECERNGIMQEIKKREFYKSPSVIKKEKLAKELKTATNATMYLCLLLGSQTRRGRGEAPVSLCWAWF